MKTWIATILIASAVAAVAQDAPPRPKPLKLSAPVQSTAAEAFDAIESYDDAGSALRARDYASARDLIKKIERESSTDDEQSAAAALQSFLDRVYACKNLDQYDSAKDCAKRQKSARHDAALALGLTKKMSAADQEQYERDVAARDATEEKAKAHRLKHSSAAKGLRQ